MKNLYDQLAGVHIDAVAALCNTTHNASFANLLREVPAFNKPFTLGEAAVRATLRQLEALVNTAGAATPARVAFPVTIVGIGRGDKTYYAAYDTTTNVRGPLCDTYGLALATVVDGKVPDYTQVF